MDHETSDQVLMLQSDGLSTAESSDPGIGYWEPTEARFTLAALPIIWAIPLITVVCLLFLQLERVRWARKFRRPLWLRNIIDTPPDALRPANRSKRAWHSFHPAIWLALAAILGLAVQFTKVLVESPLYDEIPTAQAFAEPLFLVIAWLLTCLLAPLNRPKQASIVLLIQYTCICTVECITLFNEFDSVGHCVLNSLGAIAALLGMIIVLNLSTYDPRLSKRHVASASSTPTRTLRSPEDNITLWQFLTVSWMSPLISVGYSRQLHDEDIWTLSYQFLHKSLHEAFQEVHGSIVTRVVKANGIDIIITMSLGLLELLMQLAVPVVLQQLLRRMQDPDSPPRAAITYAALIMAAEIVSAQANQLNLWYCRRAYERSRGEMITTMYEKTMSRKMAMVGAGEHLDDPEEMEKRRSASKGKILNLMRGDVYNVAQRFWEIPPLVQKPIGLVLSIVLVWKFIGWPCLLGMLTVGAAQAINALIIRLLLKLERRRRGITDTKLQQTASLVEAIRHLRWYGWQDSWLNRIMETRQRELNMRLVTGLCRLMISFINYFATTMFPVVAFFAYTKLAGLRLTVDIAFPAFALFGMLDSSLREIPNLITVVLDAYIAVGRLQLFLEEEDKTDEYAPADAGLRLHEASFAWPGTEDCVLRDLTLSFPTGLTVITGKVGSGKTAMLQSLLGELDVRSGELVRPEGGIAYCAQIPWLESKSIRENILFALPYDDSRYKQVIDACALIQDFSGFKNGDLTNIGENGVGLSGGQRARIVLARALYSRAKIVLLDDPLSALDLATSRYVIERCFGSHLLSDRTTLLVTNHSELFRGLAAQEVIIEDGHAWTQTRIETDANSDSSGHAAANGDMNGKIEPADKALATDEAIADKFIEDEHRAEGGVPAAVYWRYIKAGRLYWWGAMLTLLAIYRFFAVMRSWFLKAWGEAYNTEQQAESSSLAFLHDLPTPDDDVTPWLLWFFAISAAQAFAYLIGRCLMLAIVYSAGKQLFQEVMHKVCHTTFRFYDVTPVGRLMNRMTGDINTVDGNISLQFVTAFDLAFTWLSSIIVIASVTPIFLVFSFALTVGFVLIFLRFLPTSQSLRRLEMVSLSPLMTDFGALMDGLLTIRAFGVQQRFQDRLIKVVDSFQGMDHFYWSLQAWLQYRFDLLSALATFILTLLAVYTKVSPGLTAFVLIAANKLVSSTHALCKQYGQLQMDFVSVERIVELLHLEQEPPGSIEPPASWPSLNSDIEFNNLTIRYAPHLDPALTKISFKIKAGSNVALIGRTGCGKTTLALSLLATLPPENGNITIDGIDISEVNKQTLRSRVTFLAQEPVLFPGTLRENLDPLTEYSDDECTDVLSRTCSGYGWTLSTHVESGGKNLSQGQRQLVALARALLRRSEIVIMDEATASIDAETASRVQNMIREELRGSTVITIAHRMEAIRSADSCVLLSEGRVVEVGSPEVLLRDGGSGVAGELSEDLTR